MSRTTVREHAQERIVVPDIRKLGVRPVWFCIDVEASNESPPEEVAQEQLDP